MCQYAKCIFPTDTFVIHWQPETDILTFGTLFAIVFADAEGIHNIKRINNKFKYKDYEH